MPTTATVASPHVPDARDAWFGLRDVIELIGTGALPGIAGSARLDLHVSTRADVEAGAAALRTDVVEVEGGLVKAAASISGVAVTVYTVDRTRLLRRDPDATAILAERDA